MTWNISQHPDEVFSRNPLVSVICQLRFHPILKVGDCIADFQEGMREVFPEFAESTASVLNVQTEAAGFEVKKERQFLLRKTDGSSTLTLTTNSLAIENHRHVDRQGLFDDIDRAIVLLASLYKSVSPTRLGLRYINLIDKQFIAEALNRTLEWPDVVSGDFLVTPGGLADLQGTTFFSEVRSPMATGGSLTLRHGLLQDVESKVRFRFDMDRYVDSAFDLARVRSHLESFGEELFSMFKAAMGTVLVEWMSQKEGS